MDSLTAADYEIYGATNGITAIQTGRMAHSDISPYFNHIFISEKMGTQKPEALFYEKIAEQVPDFDLSQILMIGDFLTADIAGANNAGLDSIWYNPKQLEKGEIGAASHVQNHFAGRAGRRWLLSAHRFFTAYERLGQGVRINPFNFDSGIS